MVERIGMPDQSSHPRDLRTRTREFLGHWRGFKARSLLSRVLRPHITLHSLVSAMKVPAFVANSQGSFTAFNEAFAHFHRFSTQSEFERALLDNFELLHVALTNGTPVSLADWAIPRALRGETGSGEEYVLRRKDTGEEWTGSYTYGPIRDSAGAIIGSVITAEDITERKRADEQLRTTSSRLHLALSSVHLGVWDWNVRDNSMTWDDRMLELYGLRRSDFPNTVAGWEGPLHPEDRQRAVGAVQAALRGEADFDTEFRVVHPDGKILHLKANGLVLRAADGSPERMLGVNADITQAKRAEEELRRAYSQIEAKVIERTAELEAAKVAAENANRAKDLFLATLSHELRTPLSAILSWSQLIERGLLPPEKVPAAIRTIKENVWAQSQLISDLLDISRIAAGKIQIDKQPLHVKEVVTAAIESIRVTAEQRGLTIHEHVQGPDAYVLADPARLKQVLLNLLSNAIKFTPSGGSIFVTTESGKTTKGEEVRISIRDTGKGIRTDFLSQLFAPFTQADPSSVRLHGGLGLGLSLVRSLIELHGGTITAQSPGEGKGSTFTITLPMLETGTQPVAVELTGAERNHKDALEHIKILLVEDNTETRQALTHLLSSYGADVIAASCAEDALKELDRFSPSVIVSDIAMPRESGHSLLRKIRTRGKDRCGETPAIALTAFAEPRDQEEAFASGFQAYLTKPVDADNLIRTVGHLAGRG